MNSTIRIVIIIACCLAVQAAMLARATGWIIGIAATLTTTLVAFLVCRFILERWVEGGDK